MFEKKETVACTQEDRRKEPEKPTEERKEQEDTTQWVCGPDQVLAPIPRWRRIRVEWGNRQVVGWAVLAPVPRKGSIRKRLTGLRPMHTPAFTIQ